MNMIICPLAKFKNVEDVEPGMLFKICPHDHSFFWRQTAFKDADVHHKAFFGWDVLDPIVFVFGNFQSWTGKDDTICNNSSSSRIVSISSPDEHFVTRSNPVLILTHSPLDE